MRGNERVADLVIGDAALFIGIETATATLRTGNDLLNGLFKIALRDRVRPSAHGQQCGLVEHICKVRAGHSGGGRCHTAKVDVSSELLAARVDLENRLPTIEIGRIHDDLAIKPARAQQCTIENLGGWWPRG